MQTERCDKGAAVAYAAHCQQETGFERLIVLLLFCYFIE